jgi:hypothetical protein
LIRDQQKITFSEMRADC